MVSIFTFLGEVNGTLSDLAIQAEVDMWSNPRATLTQGRLFSEEMAITVSKMEKIEPVYVIKPNERIHLLVRKGIFLDEIKESFEWLRRQGNIAVHDIKPVPPDLALTAHRHMFTLALWFAESYGSLDIELPVYSMPSMSIIREIENNESKPDISEQLEQLLTEKLEDRILPTLTKQFKQLQDSINQVVTMSPTVQKDKMAYGSYITVDVPTKNNIIKELEDPIEIGEYLLGKDFTIIDKRKNGGALWVVGGWELKDELIALKSQGIYFKFAKAGSQSTKRRPAWFMISKDPTELRWVEKSETASDSMRFDNEASEISVKEIVSSEFTENSEVIIQASSKILTPAPLEKSIIDLKSQKDLAQGEINEIRKSFLNKELVFPASMAGMNLDDLSINGCGSLLVYLKEECRVSVIQDLPEDLPNLAAKINGVGPRAIDRFVKQLEEAIQEEKRLIGLSKRKESTVLAYRELKKRLDHRPSYLELHQLGRVNSQEYRQVFDSYPNFLLQMKELEKKEATIAKKYGRWFKEIENTIIRKSYKMALLFIMLERGIEKWMEPITADEAAPFFYDYYMNDEFRKKIDFSDNETQKMWGAPIERTSQLISRMPMTHWAKSGKRLVDYANGYFTIGFQVREVDRELVYKWTREICEYRLIEYFERKNV
ncbi:hypothetical protein V4V36_24170 [Paenibacillus lautus]|uniref:hypothetical protein n=1 Tax=Paenibacillus lautus TaxID=1401 RepID=UPI002FBE01F1